MVKEAARYHQIRARFSEAEYARVTRLAGGTPSAEWLRAYLLDRERMVSLEALLLTLLGEVLATRGATLAALSAAHPTVGVEEIARRANLEKRTRALAAVAEQVAGGEQQGELLDDQAAAQDAEG